MKRLFLMLFVLVGLAVGYTASAQQFGEFFTMSTKAADSVLLPNGSKGVITYADSIAKFAENRGLIYVNYLKYTGEVLSYIPPEPKDAAWIYDRYFHLGGLGSLPDGYLMGKNLLYPYNDNTVLVQQDRWDAKLAEAAPYVVTPVISDVKLVTYPTIQILTMKFKVEGDAGSGAHVIAVLTENVGKYKHVFRQLLFDGPYTGETIECASLFRPTYKFEDCQVTVIVEDDANKEKVVLGAVQVPSVELGFGYSSSGAPQIALPVSIYPNPVTTELTITSADELKSVTVYDVTGKRVVLKTQKDGVSGFEYKLRTDFPAGVYFVKANDGAPVKIVKL